MTQESELKQAIKIRNSMMAYQDAVYMNMIRQINTKCTEILTDDLGSEFVINCGRDLAGEVVRNCFDTSSYNITVDQLANRILHFTYEDEYDPLGNVGSDEMIRKNVYNINELRSDDLNTITSMIDESQTKLFTEDRQQDKLDKKGKKDYRESKRDNEGDLYDELTGVKGGKKTRKDGREVSNLHADHVQARETASYSARYLKEGGQQELKLFWNSADNMQLINASANTSKGDIRVCMVDGKIKYVNARSKEYDPSTDITYKATPQQLADAVISQWENVDESREQGNQPKIKELKDKGYLDENGKVPKSVRKALIRNIRHSQNEESKVILKNTNYKQVGTDAFSITKASIGKIIAGQIIYYAAPPLIYETKLILRDKNITIDNALDKLQQAGKRIGEYIFSKLKDIFSNIAFNSLRKFIKSFMDILINLVKATIKKLLKIAKNLVVSTVDAVRIIADKNANSSEKANAVFNLYGVTITACVVEILFDLASESLHIPAPFDDIVFGPLQILATVICTNFTLLVLKKADLFDVQFGFKMSKIRELFQTSKEEMEADFLLASDYADAQVSLLIEKAKEESYEIYENLSEYDMKKNSVRSSLESVNRLFGMDINFEDDWLRFIGVSA